MSSKVLLIGLGNLGGYALEFLGRVAPDIEIIAADANEDWGIRKTNSVRLGATQLGLYPNIKFTKIDAFDVDDMTKLFKEIKPDIICNLTTLQSWWVVTELREEDKKRIDEAKFGPWLPMHLTLTYNIMKAVKKSGINPSVINASFPDATNPALAKIGMAPTIGIGNLDNRIPALRFLGAEKLGVKPDRINVYFVAHHYVTNAIPRFGNTGGAPSYLRYELDGEDVTDKIGKEWAYSQVPTRWKRPSGREANPIIASSVVKNIMAIARDTNEFTHSPGPQGLVGGYPIRLGRKGAEVVLPEDLTLEEAIKINEEGQKYDGIEKICDDGTVVFCDRTVQIMNEVLGYNCKSLHPDESESRYRELRDLFAKFKK